MDDYVNFDRHDIGRVSLFEAYSCLSRVHETKHLWKYAIISIHNALQCYLSIALRGGSGGNTWKKLHAKRWLSAFDESIGKQGTTPLPDVQLDFFMELYKKLFPNKAREDVELINWLNETRNEFIHFNADSYSVHEESLLTAFRQALRDIKETPKRSKGIFFYNDEQEEAFNSLCIELTEVLDRIGRAAHREQDRS